MSMACVRSICLTDFNPDADFIMTRSDEGESEPGIPENPGRETATVKQDNISRVRDLFTTYSGL